MAFVKVIRCDGPACSRTLDTDTLPVGWRLVSTPGEEDRHFCSWEHARQWIQVQETDAPSADTAPADVRSVGDAVREQIEESSAASAAEDASGSDETESGEAVAEAPTSDPVIEPARTTIEMVASAGLLNETDLRGLIFVVRYHREHGYMPTGPDVGNGIGMSGATGYAVLRRLVDQNLITRSEILPKGAALADDIAKSSVNGRVEVSA